MVARLVALLTLAGAGWLVAREARAPRHATAPGQGGHTSSDWPAMGLDLSLDMGLGDDWSLGGWWSDGEAPREPLYPGGDMSTPRGIRNNNPGNIEAGDPWQGLDDPADDGRFARFVSPEYGIRAMARVLTNYRLKHDLRTVGSIVQRWAPPTAENHTNAYIIYVADRLGVNPAVEFDVIGRLPELIAAMIAFENGQQPYAMATIEKGVALA